MGALMRGATVSVSGAGPEKRASVSRVAWAHRDGVVAGLHAGHGERPLACRHGPASTEGFETSKKLVEEQVKV